MARMAAGVRKREDGTFEKRFTVEGKRYSVYGKTTKEVAEKEQEKREAIKAGTYTKNANITLDRYFSEWVERKEKTIKGSTLCGYKNNYKNSIQPTLGKKKIRAIERREVIALQSKLSERMTVESCKTMMATLKLILEDAVRDDIIIKNPAAGIPTLKSDGPKATETYHRALTVEEQQAFMDELKGDYYYTFIAMMLSTGMRMSEVAALQWGDIDRQSGMIHVRRTATVDADGKRIIGTTTKTPTSVRDIPITTNVATILQEQRTLMRALPMPTVSVFASMQGKIVRHNIVNQVIDDTLGRLDEKGIHIEHFSSHALRDTFATRYIEGGGTLQTLKTILGHTSLKMTADLYSHVMPNTKQEEMNMIHIAI